MPVSFTSLTLASVNIFYSLRLGRFSEPNPSIKMILFIFPLQVLYQLVEILFVIVELD